MRLVLFSDLDGTLLDHESYSHASAAPALARLRQAGVPLVMASSKTAAEMAPLHAALGLGDAPFIVENGAGIVRPGDGSDDDSAWQDVRKALAALPERLRTGFQGFADMPLDEIARITGLPRDAAARARARRFSEPGLWLGSDADRAAFVAHLADHGIAARAGGRFLSLSHGRTKADAMAGVAAELGATTTIALGDAPNDAEMLAAADRGVIVRNDHAPPMPDLPGGRIVRTDAAGPEGWNAAVLALLDEFGL